MEDKKNDVKYVRVQAYEKEYAGDLDRKWQVSEIKFTLAHKGKDKAIIDPKEAKYKFEKLKGAGGKGSRADKEQSLAEKYEYKESYGDWNDKFTYTFEPQAHLCEPDDGSFYVVMLPVKCEYDGASYDADIPLRLKGKDPDPFENWNEEYKKLKERIEKYSLPEDKDTWLKKVDELALDPRASTQQLRLTSKIIVRNYMRYWLIEGQKYRVDAEIYDSIVSQLEWIKFIGDCAFSFLVNAYAGPVAEAIISPAKDYLTESIGEVIACWNHGTSIDIEKFSIAKTLEDMGDNIVSGHIDFTKGWKQAAAALAAYFVYASIKNFLSKLREDGEMDLYGALVGGFKDLTVQSLKAGAGALFEKWIKNNKKFQETVGKWFRDSFNKNLGKGKTFDLRDNVMHNVQYDLNNSLKLEGELRKLAGWQGESSRVRIDKIDILQKYLTEWLGGKCSDVSEKIGDHPEFSVNEAGHVIFSFTYEWEDGGKSNVKVDLNMALSFMSGGLFTLVYDNLFGMVPSASSVISAPTDPPLPPEKK